MNELLVKQVNAQKEKIFRGSRKLPQAHEKCVMKMKGGEEKKRHTRKNYIHGRKPFIILILRNCQSDLHEPHSPVVEGFNTEKMALK